MTGRALLTAILFGSAIAGTRLVAHVPQTEPQGHPQNGGDGSTARGCLPAPDAAPACRD